MTLDIEKLEALAEDRAVTHAVQLICGNVQTTPETARHIATRLIETLKALGWIPPADVERLQAALDEERRKFQQETLRTSEQVVLLVKWKERCEDEHAPGPWARGCKWCALVGETTELLSRPINTAKAMTPDQQAAYNAALDAAAEQALTVISKASLEGVGPRVSRLWLLRLTKDFRQIILALKSPSPDYVVVPVEPTPEMIRAGHHQIDWCRDKQNTSEPDHPSQKETIGGEATGTSCADDVRDAYRAMLKAAGNSTTTTSPSSLDNTAEG
jgi:hypothetical protein